MFDQSLFEHVKFVSAAVLAGEDRIDGSLAATARMIADALDAHRQVGMPAYAVQPALDHMEKALLGQFESRRQIAMAHFEFGKTASRMGVTVEDYGDLWPCPQFPKPAAQRDNVHTLVGVA